MCWETNFNVWLEIKLHCTPICFEWVNFHTSDDAMILIRTRKFHQSLKLSNYSNLFHMKKFLQKLSSQQSKSFEITLQNWEIDFKAWKVVLNFTPPSYSNKLMKRVTFQWGFNVCLYSCSERSYTWKWKRLRYWYWTRFAYVIKSIFPPDYCRVVCYALFFILNSFDLLRVDGTESEEKMWDFRKYLILRVQSERLHVGVA